jgi:hypothetical protein
MGLEPEDTVATTAKRNCHPEKTKEEKRKKKTPAVLRDCFMFKKEKRKETETEISRPNRQFWDSQVCKRTVLAPARFVLLESCFQVESNGVHWMSDSRLHGKSGGGLRRISRVDNGRVLCCSLRLAFLGVGIVPRRKSDDKVGDVEHDAFEPMTLTILGCKLATIAMLKGNLSKLT